MNHKFVKRFLLLLLLPVCLVSCRKSAVAALLDDVESYIQTRPDSALSVLSQTDTTLLSTPRLRAHYALLQAIALDKNYFDTTDLRVIRPAVEFYQKHGTAQQKMQAYYYQGRILYNARRDGEAIISQIHALDNARIADSGRYLGMIYTAMAALTIRSSCWEDSELYLSRAEEAFREVKDTAALLLILESEVKNLANQGRKEQALEMVDSLLCNTQMPDRVRGNYLFTKAAIMVDTALIDLQPALDCYLAAFKTGAKPTINQKARYAYTLALCGHETEADQLFSSLMNSADPESQRAGKWKQDLLAREGRYEDAYNLLKGRLQNQAEIVNELLSQSLFRTQRDYFRAKETDSSLRNHNQRLVIVILILSFILLLSLSALIITRFKHMTETKELEMERFSESVSRVLSEKTESIANLQSQFRLFYDAQFRLLEYYYKDFEIARRSGAGDKELYEKLLKIIKDIEGDTQGQRFLDSLIDQKHKGIMHRLHDECPLLSKQDYLLFSYTAAGFDSSTIGMLFGNLSADALHMRRSRLRRAIKENNPPSLSDFLSILNMRQGEC